MLDLSQGLADIVAKNGDGIVRIESGCRGGGSGLVWAADRVVTAAHLLEDDTVRVGLPDGRSVEAKVLGRDEGTDVALLGLDGEKLVPPARVGLDDAKVGHLTISLARPGKTVRAALGMIGTLGEAFRARGGGKIDRYLQPDGGIPAGFAGGALFDLHGRVLGLNTPALHPEAGLTIPTTTLERVVAEIAAHGRVRRGYFGVGVAPVRLPGALSQKYGQHGAAIVVAIEPGGPSEKGGLVLGDVLLSIDGQVVEGPRELSALLEGRIDVDVHVKLLRAGAPTEATVHATARP
ncbi:MAG: trypsin-like peptidase domain-containing protein [Myxococcales bacterium]|nr:trypsin-like peptidase domain-containing protein [Myxococcales bacterium]